MKTTQTFLKTVFIGITALIWTTTGESSNPILADRDIPVDVASACAQAPTGGSNACPENAFSQQWVAKTLRGDLYLLTLGQCVAPNCRAWLVEKTESTAHTLLSFTTTYRLRAEINGYPMVESYATVSSNSSEYSRYVWSGEAYVRTENRQVYHVDGVTCGTREECRQAATEAVGQKRVDRAVRIWENVGNISWI